MGVSLYMSTSSGSAIAVQRIISHCLLLETLFVTTNTFDSQLYLPPDSTIFYEIILRAYVRANLVRQMSFVVCGTENAMGLGTLIRKLKECLCVVTKASGSTIHKTKVLVNILIK